MLLGRFFWDLKIHLVLGCYFFILGRFISKTSDLKELRYLQNPIYSKPCVINTDSGLKLKWNNLLLELTNPLEDVQSINWASSRPVRSKMDEKETGCEPAKLSTAREKCDDCTLVSPCCPDSRLFYGKMCKDRVRILKKLRY